MSRLPIPGSDQGAWGDILNDYLSQSHAADGSLKAGVVTGAVIADGSVSATQLDGLTQASLAKADAAIQPTDPRLSDARTPTPHASSHAAGQADAVTVAQSQVSNLTVDLAGKLSTASNLADVASAQSARTNLVVLDREYPVYWDSGSTSWGARPNPLPAGFDRAIFKSFWDPAAADPSSIMQAGDVWWWAAGGGPS